jgi:hypothetical protein
VLVHVGLTAMVSREAHRRCRTQELAAGGAKGGGHSGDPYRPHKRAVEGGDGPAVKWS